MTLTQEELECLLRDWQAVMRLQDWDIKVKLCRARDLDGANRQAECGFTLPLKEAVIRILDPLDWVECDFPQDHENDLIHELLHLHMAPFEPAPDGLAAKMMEQAVCSIAKGLLTLKRTAKEGQR